MNVFNTGGSWSDQSRDGEYSDPVGVSHPLALWIGEKIELLPSSVLHWLEASESAVETVLNPLHPAILSFINKASDVRGTVSTNGSLHQEVNSPKLMRGSGLSLASLQTPSAAAKAKALGAKPTRLATSGRSSKMAEKMFVKCITISLSVNAPEIVAALSRETSWFPGSGISGKGRAACGDGHASSCLFSSISIRRSSSSRC